MRLFIVSLIVIQTLFEITSAQTDSIGVNPEISKQSYINETSAEIPDSSGTLMIQKTSPKVTTSTDSGTAIYPMSQPQQDSQNSEPVVISSNSQFNPLAYGRRLSFGPYIPYLYYHERIRLNDVVRSFEEMYGQPPDTIQGEPKSTEYGLTVGFSFKFLRIFPHSGIMFRPQISLLIGPGTTYDGSQQGKAITNSYGDTIGIGYQPVTSKKSNIFVKGGIDLGYSNHTYRTAFALFSGIRYSFWYRDLGSNSQIRNCENYYWASIPVGFMTYTSIGSQWVLGLEGVVDYMFYGAMQAEMHARQNKSVGVNFPEVSLGNKLGYSLDLMFGKKIGEHLLFQIVPFASLYGFGKSETEHAIVQGPNSSTYEKNNSFAFYEPESSTLLIGLNISFNILLSPLK